MTFPICQTRLCPSQEQHHGKDQTEPTVWKYLVKCEQSLQILFFANTQPMKCVLGSLYLQVSPPHASGAKTLNALHWLFGTWVWTPILPSSRITQLALKPGATAHSWHKHECSLGDPCLLNKNLLFWQPGLHSQQELALYMISCKE
jgi:hypothetical protein